MTGFNIKPEQGHHINIHAEQMAIEKVRRAGLNKIFAIAVWGEPQPDQQSGIVSRTLHPCGLCRDMMADRSEIGDHTLLLSGNAGFSTCEIYDLKELQVYHDRTEPERSELDHLNLADVVLDDRSYDEALGFLLLRKWVQLNPNAPYSEGLAEWFKAGQPTK